jgi:23S rRNA (pseudouridine1915-N3)-methyltransferase
VKLTVVAIGVQARDAGSSNLAEVYLARLPQYCTIETRFFRSLEAFIEYVTKLRGRTAPVVVLLDSRGKAMTSEEFAGWIGRQRDNGVQHLVFAVGPADGWSAKTRESASLLLSFGPMTLPHELARVVLVEQVYRAFTILANHPYHGGH